MSVPSLYRLRAPVDLALLGGTSVVNIGAHLARRRLMRAPRPPSMWALNGVDRFVVGFGSRAADRVADLAMAGTIVGALALLLRDAGRGTAFLEDALVFGEAMAVNGALVTLVKFAVQRPTPLVYAGVAHTERPGGERRGFYSGHTASACAALAAAARTATLRHPERRWPWVLVPLVGLAVGMARIAGGRHFPTDVLAGMAAGTLVGLFVPTARLRRRR